MHVSSRTCELDVLDRVGGGDGLAVGFFGLLTGAYSAESDTGESSADAVRLGWADGALITTYPDDTTMATVEQVRSFAGGGLARIQR